MFPSGGDRLFPTGAETDGACWDWGSIVGKSEVTAGSSATGFGKKRIDWNAWEMKLLISEGSRLGCMLSLRVIACHRLGSKAAKALLPTPGAQGFGRLG
ncbi:hypothetical protein A4A49_21349 [Nicotiana attenuata]|uniref:Uncharacterized protein n=1 Tax=Nicotiana attenuata TaxID=49451 RepID=A0A314LEX1_NICAT|nr:hypothetical protein A4A49_21349 [Nicotiana attenuata]